MNERCHAPPRKEASSLAPVSGSANVTRSQLEILDHTEHRAAGGLYCGGSPDMDALVAAGLMEFAGRKSFVPDAYYRITSKGRALLRSQNARTEPPASKP